MYRITALFLAILSVFTLIRQSTVRAEITVDTEKLSDTPVGNKVSNVNVWEMGKTFYSPVRNPDYDVFEFVEYVQLMECSGGNAVRDLFKDPSDRTVLDDYDFDRLLKNCHGILSLGAKPLLKLGNVPEKYTTGSEIGGFEVNIYPPDDYNVYYNYIYALADALVQEFGREEVLTWRFGVLTEFENADWFMAKGGNPKDSLEAYCKLYDYTVQALIDAIGEDVFVGAHSMAVTQGLWDERKFIRHVAKERNYATGEIGTRICYLSASFYDSSVGHFTTGYTFPDTIKHLRRTAERYGLRDLIFGVDEGRILSGTPGADSDALAIRVVGYTWQGAYDARLWTNAIENNIDYFSSWGFLTGGLMDGFPTISYHVATLVHKMADGLKATVHSTTNLLWRLFKIEVNGTATYNTETNTANVLLYNFKNELEYDKKADVSLKMHLPQFAGKTVTLTTYKIDDDCNFFDEWVEDRKTYNITDDCFSWSPDDPTIDNVSTLKDSEARNLYFSTLRDKYIECAKLTPTTETVTVGADGTLNLHPILDPNTALFLEIH